MLALLLATTALAAPVTGAVKERGTGDPVAGATLVTDGAASLTTTGPLGRFTVDLPPGTHTLSVLSESHLPGALVLDVPETGLAKVLFFVHPAPPPPEIVVEARRASDHPTQRVLDRERVEKTPGTHDDAARLIQALPGVAMTPEYGPQSGDLAIRGAAPGDSQVLLDGVRLPYLFHFQQYSSVLHTRLLDEVALAPSSVGPSYGGMTGGVAAVRSRRADPAQLHGGLNFNAIMAGGFVQTPVGDRWAVSASARRSYADLYESSNDQYTAWPVFWDYLTRVDHENDRGDATSVMVVGAGDTYGRFAGDTEALNPVEQAENPGFDFGRAFHGLVGTWERVEDRQQHRSAAGVVWDEQSGSLPTASSRRDELSLDLRHTSVFQGCEEWGVALGGDLRASRVGRQATTDRAWAELADESPLLARGVPVDEVLLGVVGGVYVEPRVRLGDVELRPSLRGQGASGVGLAAEPRGQLRAEVSDALRLRFAAGRHTQAPTLDQRSAAGGTPALPLTTSVQQSAGADLLLSGRWELSMDAWSRALDHAILEAPGQAPRSVDGEAYGVELVSRYRVRNRFFSWVALSLGRSTRDGAPYAYDQPWSLSVVASWDITDRWNVGARYRIAAGLPYTPITGGTYNGDTDAYEPIFGAPFSQRLPTYSKLDTHIERSWRLRRWTLVAYLETWWVPARYNTLYPVYSYDFSQQDLVAGPGLLPLLGVRARL